ncbi:MAG: hypothetical protein OEM81_04805 [Acidimicrobiia bacterium]|nr:hypothetical protein [Acidimicrobiia bacterium]MDH3397136.1 hypothetical protein [Acidimicrobiia bacterium]
MASFDGSLRSPNESKLPVRVLIDLTDERLRLWSGKTEIANWRLGEVQISAQSDGFHIRRGGEEQILDIQQDAEFAVALDLRSVPVGLARRMAVHRDSLR